MALTAAQYQALHTDITANQSANAQAGNHGAVCAYYNATGTGLVWRPSISVQELNTAIVWTDFAGLSVALQNTYMAMIVGGVVNATSTNIQTGFATVFAGKTTLTNLVALAQRIPTRLEQLFAVNGVTPVFGMQLQIADVITALGS